MEKRADNEPLLPAEPKRNSEFRVSKYTEKEWAGNKRAAFGRPETN